MITWTIAKNQSESDYRSLRGDGQSLVADDRSMAYMLRTPATWAAGTAKLGFVWSPDSGTTKLALNVTVAVVADVTPDGGQLLVILPGYLAALAKIGGTVALRTLNAAGAAVIQSGGPLTVTGYPVQL